MYRITRTIYNFKNGETKFSDDVLDVESIEEYRESIKKDEHESISFIYQELDDEKPT